jgi:hypothetical protein
LNFAALGVVTVAMRVVWRRGEGEKENIGRRVRANGREMI